MSNISIAVGQCGLQIFDSTLSAMHKGPDYDDLKQATTSTNISSSLSRALEPTSAPVGTARRALLFSPTPSQVSFHLSNQIFGNHGFRHRVLVSFLKIQEEETTGHKDITTQKVW